MSVEGVRETQTVQETLSLELLEAWTVLVDFACVGLED